MKKVRYHNTGYTIEVINNFGKRVTSWHKHFSNAITRARNFIPFVKNPNQIEIINNDTGNSFIFVDTYDIRFKLLSFDELERRIAKRIKYPKV